MNMTAFVGYVDSSGNSIVVNSDGTLRLDTDGERGPKGPSPDVWQNEELWADEGWHVAEPRERVFADSLKDDSGTPG